MAATRVTNLYPVPTTGATAKRLTVDATAGGVAVDPTTIHPLTQFVYLNVQDADVIVTFDGSVPSVTNGHILPVGFIDTWDVRAFTVAKFIRRTGTSGVVYATEQTI
jgi:hypothetical protein